MSTQLDIAQALDDAADYILIHGLHRGELTDRFNKYCTVGAIYQVTPDGGSDETCLGTETCKTLEQYLYVTGRTDRMWQEGRLSPVAEWSDNSSDDFVVIDTLRHCAKDLRNSADV